jgi:hypothetical protein
LKGRLVAGHPPGHASSPDPSDELLIGSSVKVCMSDNVGVSKFVAEKLKVAAALDVGECGGDYIDSAVIMAAVLNAIASQLWPGKGHDRKRFVELWATYCDPEARRVSVPLLSEWLRNEGRRPEAETIEGLHAAEFFWPVAVASSLAMMLTWRRRTCVMYVPPSR